MARGGDQSEEPVDYRFTLANERTFLAWIRTSLALDAGGLAVLQFVDPLPVEGARELIGLGLVVVGTLLSGLSFRRWLLIDRAMRAQRPLPTSWLPAALAVAVVVASLVAAVLLAQVHLR